MTDARPWRVLHVLSSLHVGGAGRLLLANASGLGAHGFESHVAYLTPRSELVPALQVLGIEPVCLDHRRRLHGPRTVLRLCRMIRHREIDLVHTHLFLDRLLGGLAAWLVGRPTVTTLHTGGEGQDLRGRHRLEDLLSRRWTRRYLAVSETVAVFQAQNRHLPSDRIEVVHSGIELEPFTAPIPEGRLRALRSELHLGPEGPVLVHVGRLAREKGQRHLLPMMAKVLDPYPEATLLLVGEGDERAWIESTARDLGIQRSVCLAGRRSDIASILALADLFLFPSEPGEGLGLALLEAMAAGKPVVASRLPALAEVVEDGRSGVLVPPGDAEALAQAVLALLERPELRERLGRAGRKIVEQRFDAERAVARLAEIYRTVLQGFPR